MRKWFRIIRIAYVTFAVTSQILQTVRRRPKLFSKRGVVSRLLRGLV